MYFRKSIMLGLTVLAIAGGWLARTSAKEKSSSSVVTYFDHEKVDAAFARNAPLFGGESGLAKYKVLTARRDHPGEVEIHNLDTDIIYVLSGTATFVTGGTPVAAKTTAPDEIRGQAIQGGDSHRLSKGDVIIVPAGVPHWFQEVKAPFLYFVVKVH
jgi:mannose-6-phosphate isomerase-like protein (cupin superfamily)